MKSISIIICTYNRAKYLPLSLNALLSQTADSSSFETIVVNNNSSDNTEEICKKFIDESKNKLDIKYCVEKKQGLSYARNRGIVESSSDWVTYIDDDALVEADFIENIITFISLKQGDANFVGLGGKIIPKYIDGKPRWMSHFIEGLVSKVDNGNKAYIHKGSTFPIGCNMTYKKLKLIEIGLFDTELGRNLDNGFASEEKDIFFKLINRNYTVWYDPNVVVHHIIENSRLQYPYIKRISMGIGSGERIRTRKIGKIPFIYKWIEMVYKFTGACILALLYLLRLDVPKAKALVLFRINVWRGFIQG